MTLAKRSADTNTAQDHIASKVMETSPLIMRFIRSKMKERPDTSTSVPQIRVMAFIENNPGCSLSSLSEFLGITSASASTMIDRLVRGGLVDRVIDPIKRRKVILHLTAKGQKELLGARHFAVGALSDQLSKLDGVQLRQVEESMTLLKAIFSTVQGDRQSPSAHAITTLQSSEEWNEGQLSHD